MEFGIRFPPRLSECLISVILSELATEESQRVGRPRSFTPQEWQEFRHKDDAL